jgi:hypothetical protein
MNDHLLDEFIQELRIKFEALPDDPSYEVFELVETLKKDKVKQ